MDSYRDIYKRFITNYRTENGGINLYPQFDYDLELLLDWLENDDAMWDWAPGGIYLPEYETDCTWRPVDDKEEE